MSLSVRVFTISHCSLSKGSTRAGGAKVRSKFTAFGPRTAAWSAKASSKGTGAGAGCGCGKASSRESRAGSAKVSSKGSDGFSAKASFRGSDAFDDDERDIRIGYER